MRYFTGARRRAVTALVASGTLLGLAASPATSASPAHERRAVYVALGDSYSSGPVIPPQADPVTCLRSSVNYPGLVAQSLEVDVFRDVTCSGATTRNLTTSQPANTPGGPAAAPQYDALTRNTTLVTVGIGGNDIGLIGLATGCVTAASNPTGPTCQEANGRTYEKKIDAFAATYAGSTPSGPGRRAPASSSSATRRRSARADASRRSRSSRLTQPTSRV